MNVKMEVNPSCFGKYGSGNCLKCDDPKNALCRVVTLDDYVKISWKQKASTCRFYFRPSDICNKGHEAGTGSPNCVMCKDYRSFHADWTEWLYKIVKEPGFTIEGLLEHVIKHLKEKREENDEKSWFASLINLIGLLLRATDYRADIFKDDIDYEKCVMMFERHEKKAKK